MKTYLHICLSHAQYFLCFIFSLIMVLFLVYMVCKTFGSSKHGKYDTLSEASGKLILHSIIRDFNINRIYLIKAMTYNMVQYKLVQLSKVQFIAFIYLAGYLFDKQHMSWVIAPLCFCVSLWWICNTFV